MAHPLLKAGMGTIVWLGLIVAYGYSVRLLARPWRAPGAGAAAERSDRSIRLFANRRAA